MLPNYGVRTLQFNTTKVDDIITPTNPLEYIASNFDFGFCKVFIN